MSAKNRSAANSQGAASPNDDGDFPTTEKDWNFRPIMEAFASARDKAPRGKKQGALDDPSGRTLTAMAFYEYARESATLRGLLRQWMECDARLNLRNGKGWRRRLEKSQRTDASRPRRRTDSRPWFPEQLTNDRMALHPDYSLDSSIRTTITQGEDSIGSAGLIWLLREHLAVGSAWTDLPEIVRSQAIKAAWNDPPSDSPHWPSEIETEEERARAGRDIRKGERPFLTLSCHPEMPEAVHEVAGNDRERELAERQRFANVRRTDAAEQRRADAIEAAWKQNRPDPRLPLTKRKRRNTSDLREIDCLGHEHLVVRIPWYLPNEEIAAQFAQQLKEMRPPAYQDFDKTNANAEISAPLIALRNLGARRILRDTAFRGCRKQEIASAYWKAIGEHKGKNWDRRFSEALKEAGDRLHLLGLD